MEIAQIISGIDDTILFGIIVLLGIGAAVLLFLRARHGRQAEARDVWRQKIGDLPPITPVHSGAYPSRTVPKREPAPVSDIDLTENSDNLQESLRILAGKYSLESFTIATADGLVFASSGGDTARDDAAYYSRHSAGKDPAGMIIFSLDHKGSALTGIVRSPRQISPEIRKQLETDTKDILNWWI